MMNLKAANISTTGNALFAAIHTKQHLKLSKINGKEGHTHAQIVILIKSKYFSVKDRFDLRFSI